MPAWAVITTVRLVRPALVAARSILTVARPDESVRPLVDWGVSDTPPSVVTKLTAWLRTTLFCASLTCAVRVAVVVPSAEGSDTLSLNRVMSVALLEVPEPAPPPAPAPSPPQPASASRKVAPRASAARRPCRVSRSNMSVESFAVSARPPCPSPRAA